MKRFLLLSGYGLILLFMACSPGNKVSIEDHNLSDSLDTRQNLVFDFSHELAPDSIIGKWDSTEYLGISPAIKGLFKWNSAKQLVFSPSAGFRPATEYQLSPNTNLLRFSGGRLSLEATVLRFRTASLQLTGMQTWWTLSQGSTEALCLNTSIHFNYEVDPQLLAPLISGEINGRKVQVSVPAQAPSSTLVIRADGISRAEAMDGTFSVRIQQGLKCSACGLEANQLHYMSGFKAVSSLEITQTESDYENGEGIIRIYTNQPVMMAGIEALLRVKPATSFRIDALESGLILRGAFSAGNSYEVNFSGALQGMLGGTLGQDFSSSVSFGEQEPGIAFTSGKGMYLSSKGSRKIGLQIINIPKVKVSVYKIFENNLLAFTNNNRYEDWYGEDEGSTFVYNDYDLERFGNKILEQEYEVKDLPLQDGIRLLSLDFDDEMPFRGVYLVSARSTESQWIKASKLVSVSDIGLMARTGLDQVWVFANSVKNATFLQNISVSLVSANNQVLFTGTTNGEGMVKFEGLHSRFRDFRPAMITARSGNDFNYMLLDDTRVETSRFETGGYREQPGGL
ncbi:MAG: hypothetical protein JNL88_09805, partial [Bacteroidia bacterium]|nr:hypothetical protein [Bacteroidia bacterium]